MGSPALKWSAPSETEPSHDRGKAPKSHGWGSAGADGARAGRGVAAIGDDAADPGGGTPRARRAARAVTQNFPRTCGGGGDGAVAPGRGDHPGPARDRVVGLAAPGAKPPGGR